MTVTHEVLSSGPSGGSRRSVVHNPITGQGDCRPAEIPGAKGDSEREQALGELAGSIDQPKLQALTHLLQLIMTFVPPTLVMFLEEWQANGCPEGSMIEWLENLKPEQRKQIAQVCLEIAYREFGRGRFNQETLELDIRVGGPRS